MGRMPSALADCRSKDKVDLTACVVGDGARAEMTPRVLADPNLTELWKLTVGSGQDYTAAQAPIIENYVINIAMIEDCYDHLVDKETGAIKQFIVNKDENGFEIMCPNPYSKQLEKLMTINVKLATELGLTPMARARLGLTKANTNAVNISIAEIVRRAMAEDV